jgi:predicted metal-dependent peptidase
MEIDIQAKALAKMNKIIMQWSFDDVTLLGSWCIIDKVADPKQKTMGINTKSYPPYIAYNPNFVCALSDEYLEAVMAKEGFKILLRHATTRLREPKKASNLASDVTINGHIMGGISDFGDTGTFFTAESFGLEKNKFYEEYYRRIKDIMDKVDQKVQQALSKAKQQQQGQGEGQGQGQGQGQDKDKKNGKGKGQGKGQPDDQQNQNGGGGGQGQGDQDQQDGEGQDGNTDENGFQKFDGQSDALAQHHDPQNSTANDGWGENNLFDADVQSYVDNEQKNIKNWGRHTQGMMSAIIAANTPEINPKDIVRRFQNTVLTQVSTSSRMKLNRRFGLESPGKRRTYRSRILFAVDTSGSMSNRELERGGALINATLKHAEVDWVSFDTKVYDVVKNLKRAQDTFQFKGRGGTDFQPIIDYVQEHKYDGVVILTDCRASPPTRPTKTKVLWLATSQQYKPPVDWGFYAFLPEEKDK